jgi:hypothetical protein
MAEIEAREGVSISCSQLSKALRKSSAGGGPGTRVQLPARILLSTNPAGIA